MANITQTGPQTGQEIKEQLPSTNVMTKEEADAILSMPVGYITSLQSASTPFTLLVKLDTDFGSSSYDPTGLVLILTIENILDIRANELPWYAKIAAGTGKMITTAASTFIGGIVGTVYGIEEAVRHGDASKIWDNEVYQALADFDDYVNSDVLPNYYSRDEIENPLAWRNIFSANTIGDKVIKTLGFAAGAYASGGIFAGMAKATQLPRLVGAITRSTRSSKLTAGLLGSTMQANTEAAIEATLGTRQWKEQATAEVQNTYQLEMQAIMDEYEATKGNLIPSGEGTLVDPAALKMHQRIRALQTKTLNAMQEIERLATNMGNNMYLANIAIVGPSSYIQHAKLYARGYSSLRPKFNVKGKLGDLQSTLTKPKKLLKISKGMLAEGLEEAGQSYALLAFGNLATAHLNSFYAAGCDPNAEKETVDAMNVMWDSMVEYWGSDEMKESMLLGMVVGGLGMPTIGKRKSGKTGLKWEGGVWSEWAELNKQKLQELELLDKLNLRVKSNDFKAYYKGLIRNKSFQNSMDQALIDGNEEAFKDNLYALLISDIIMFDLVGRLSDFSYLVNELFGTTDADLESFVNLTSSKDLDGNYIDGPFIEHGSPMNSTPEGKKRMIDIITNNRDTINKAIEEYRKAIKTIEISSNGQLDTDKLSELAYFKVQSKRWQEENKEAHENLRDGLTFAETESSPNVKKLMDSLSRIPSVFSSKRVTKAIKNAKINLEELVKELKQQGFLLEQVDVITLNINSIIRNLEKSDAYEDLYEKYMKDPRGLEDKFLEIENAITNAIETNAKIDRNKVVTNMSVSDLSNSSDLDDLDSMLNDLGDIDDVASQADLDNNKSKIKEARKINGTTVNVNSAIDESDGSEEAKRAARSIIEKNKKTANSVEELLSIDTAASQDNTVVYDSLTPELKLLLEGLPIEEIDDVLSNIKFEAITIIQQQAEEYLREIEEQVVNIPDNAQEMADAAERMSAESVGHDSQTKTTEVKVDVKNLSEVPTPVLSKNDIDKQTQSNSTESRTPSNGFWNPAVSEYPIHKKKGDNRKYHEIPDNGLSEDGRRILKLIHEYLTSKGAFTYVDSGLLEKGDEIVFTTDKELNEQVGHTIILMAKKNADGSLQIVGNISDVSTDAGIMAFRDSFNAQYDTYKADENNTDPFIFSTSTHVNQSMIGKINYSNEYDSLNSVHRGSKFKIGIDVGKGTKKILTSPGSVSRELSDDEKRILAPQSSMPGLPFLIVPTANPDSNYKNDRSRKTHVCVPVTTTSARVGSDKFNNSKLKIVISDIIKAITNDNLTQTNLLEIKDRLLEFFPLASFFIESSEEKIKITIKIGDKKAVISQNNKSADSLVNSVLNALQGQPLLISMKYINSTYEFMGTEYDYNELVGDVLTTNIDSTTSDGSIHTINNWFTINPLQKNDDGSFTESKASSPKSVTTERKEDFSTETSDVIDTEDYSINTKTWEVTVKNGKSISEDFANKIRAWAWGIKNGIDMTKPYDTLWGRYDAVNSRFIREESVVGKQQFDAAMKAVNDAINSNDPLMIANAYANLMSLSYRLEQYARQHPTEKVAMFESLQLLNLILVRVETTLKQHLYTITPMLESMYTGTGEETDELKVTFELNSLFPSGYITKVIKPLVMDSSGKVVQKAEVVVNRIDNKDNEGNLSESKSDNATKEESLLNSAIEKLGVEPGETSEKIFNSLTVEQRDLLVSDDISNATREQLWDAILDFWDYDNDSFYNLEDVDLLFKDKYKRAQEVEEYEVWDPEVEEAWLERALPQLSSSDRKRIVQGLIRIPKDGGYAWGKFKNGIITISDRAASGTLYHEAFHAVVGTLMTKEEVKRLFEAARKLYGNKLTLELEELLAEAFRRYVQTDTTTLMGSLRRIFRKLKHWWSSIFNNLLYIDNLFYRINKGEFANRQIKKNKSTRYSKLNSLDIYALNNQLALFTSNITKADWEYMQKVIGELKSFSAESEGSALLYAIDKGINLHTILIVLYKGRYSILPLSNLSYDLYIKTLRDLIEDLYKKDLSEDELLSQQALKELELNLDKYRRIALYHRQKLYYENLSQSDKDYLLERGVSPEEYMQMSQEEQEILFHCK